MSGGLKILTEGAAIDEIDVEMSVVVVVEEESTGTHCLR